MSRVFCLCLFLSFLTLIAPGCGSGNPGLKVTGQIMENGQALILSDGEGIRISFLPVTTGNPTDEKKSTPVSIPGVVNPKTGTFEIAGLDGKGVPPGKYKVTMQKMKDKEDQFMGKYGNPTTTPFEFDISSSNYKNLKIELTASATPAAGK